MKTLAFNQTSRFFRLSILLLTLGLTVLNSACTDQSANDDQQNQAEDASNDGNSNDSSAKVADTKTKNDKQNKEKEKPAIPVEVVAVTRSDIQQTYRTITTLEAEQDVQVVARSTGLLQKILVEEGDFVSKGQLLAQLDVEQLSLEVAQLAATSKKLNKELERQQALFSRKLGSSDALDRAQFEYQSQQAQYSLAKLKLAYASIRAPISGLVTERMVKQGNLIRDNDILFNIVNPASLKAVLHLPEKELNNVKKQQKVLLKIDAMSDQLIIGEIERIRPSIDTDTGTFRVIAKLNNQDNSLKSGMFGKVEVVFDVHQNSLVLQQQAVITQDNRSHVFVVKDNKAIQTPVTLGFRHDGMVEIADGLAEADLVITTGQQILKHQTKVEIVGQDQQEIAKEAKIQSPSSVASNP